MASLAPDRRIFPALPAFFLSCFAVAAAGGTVTARAVQAWYPRLEKPWFTPPDAVFGPVWTVLFALIAIAGFRVWRRVGLDAQDRIWSVYAVQLVLNFGWSAIFFGLKATDLALTEILVLWVAILANIMLFKRVDRLSAWLLMPYLAWVSYAALLNAAIVMMN
jgi:tryptophan-rich sensory protein